MGPKCKQTSGRLHSFGRCVVQCANKNVSNESEEQAAACREEVRHSCHFFFVDCCRPQINGWRRLMEDSLFFVFLLGLCVFCCSCCRGIRNEMIYELLVCCGCGFDPVASLIRLLPFSDLGEFLSTKMTGLMTINDDEAV